MSANTNPETDLGGKTNTDEAYDSKHGSYDTDTTKVIPQADRFQENQMPKGPDPSPFKLGPLG